MGLESVESGIRAGRTEFVRETTVGTTPSDPDWLRYSDAYQTVTPEPTASISPRRRVGSYDVQNFNAGAEDHSLSIEYDLQRAIESGSTNDASFDGLARSSDGTMQSTHSYLQRDNLGGSGNLGGGIRGYTVGKGGKIDSVNLSGEPGEGNPVMVTLDYLFEKMRFYVIHQPSGSVNVTVSSSDANDTMDITIEDDGAGTSETLTLNGTTDVVGTASFSSIDAVELASRPTGDITVEDGSGNTITVIKGSSSHDDREGDLGVPALGNGSHEGALGTSYEVFLGDTVERPSGNTGEFLDTNTRINSFEITVNNNIAANAHVGSIGKELSEGPREIEVSATLFGEKTSFEAAEQHLQVVEETIKWDTTNDTIEVTDAVLRDLGSIGKESEQQVMMVDNTFEGQGITLNSTAY